MLYSIGHVGKKVIKAIPVGIVGRAMTCHCRWQKSLLLLAAANKPGCYPAAMTGHCPTDNPNRNCFNASHINDLGFHPSGEWIAIATSGRTAQ